jgi:phosphoserine phosphatase
MTPPDPTSSLSTKDLQALLAVTRSLAAPHDLAHLLAEVAAAACQVLHAERASVWLLDAETRELVLEIASDLKQVRVPISTGLVGSCALSGLAVNVPDCYADPRFNAQVDRISGFRTRCSLTLPLVDHRGAMVGVMQILNKQGGAFDSGDEAVGGALAAQCAVALSRARMSEGLLAGELLRREFELASSLQIGSLPAAMPEVPGYAMHATFKPASLTGGDTYDLARVAQGLLVVLGDAAGHGLAPAVSVMQMHAMLRMAFRMGADLETAFRQVNDQLAQTLPDSRFVTAFIGLLDAQSHRLRFISGGQAPILHWRAAEAACTVYRAGSFPMGAMPIVRLKPAVELEMAPGDWLVLLTDGIYEYADPHGEPFGRERVEQVLRMSDQASPDELASQLMGALKDFARGAPQDDDITMVLLRRLPARP